MNLTRRKLFQLGVLVLGPGLPSSFGQGTKRRETLHPPEPGNQEFDMLLLRDRKSRSQPTMQLRERRQEFSECLQRLLDAAAKLCERAGGVPMSEVFSVQVYKQTELIERFAKQLKTLAKN
jgi:hypothetical protein